LCRAAEVSRASYYRFIKPVAEKAAEMELRDAIQKQAVQMPAYGYRRITAALQRAGWEVNHKRVLRFDACGQFAVSAEASVCAHY
jgi:putative transposase